jgi:3-phenylpropionate/cinnamic acid dioxygenase small subunit
MGTLTGTIEDREEIRELYARYAHTVDNGQLNEWIDCFSDDGVFDSPRFGKHTGREGLRRFAAIYKESLGGARPFHQITNVIFHIEGDQASGCCYLTYYHCKDGKAALSAAGRYTDKLRKVGGGWRFESRKVTIDGAK